MGNKRQTRRRRMRGGVNLEEYEAILVQHTLIELEKLLRGDLNMGAAELEKRIIEKFNHNPKRDAWNVFEYLSNQHVVNSMDDDSLMMGIIMRNITEIKQKIKNEQEFEKMKRAFQNSQNDYTAEQLNAYSGSNMYDD